MRRGGEGRRRMRGNWEKRDEDDNDKSNKNSNVRFVVIFVVRAIRILM